MRTVSGMVATAPKRIRERLGITLDAEERELAERFAESRGLSISTYLGQLLREEAQRFAAGGIGYQRTLRTKRAIP